MPSVGQTRYSTFTTGGVAERRQAPGCRGEEQDIQRLADGPPPTAFQRLAAMATGEERAPT